MRLPNGYGSIYKLTGNRRRPWVVKKSIEGKQKALGYFVTQEEALAFLVGVNRMTPEREVTFSTIIMRLTLLEFHTPGIFIPIRFPHKAGMRPTITWSHIRWFTFSGGPLKDKNDMIRLHVIVGLVFAYIAIIIWEKIGVFVRWGTCKTYTPWCHS